MLFKKKKDIVQEHNRIITDTPGKGASCYNRLKDNVLYMSADGKTKVFQVESSMPNEGKTTVLCNLAVSLGLTDKRVVVVDLDFRRPRAHRLFELSRDVGIVEYMLGSADYDAIIKKTKYKNVDLITRGAEVYNSSLVLLSDKFVSLIAKLKENYDFVLLDCAPVLQVSDYIHISKVSDGVLFMVASGTTTKSQITEAIKELKKNDAKILGTVLTMCKAGEGRHYGYEYGYGYYNGAYYGDTADEEEPEENAAK